MHRQVAGCYQLKVTPHTDREGVSAENGAKCLSCFSLPLQARPHCCPPRAAGKEVRQHLLKTTRGSSCQISTSL